MLNSGERQVSPTLDGIRQDHKARYEWAAQLMPKRSHVLDVACGVGYGAYILALAGHTVVAIDRDAEAIAYAREHYRHKNINYFCVDVTLFAFTEVGQFDYGVMFEAIEHIANPLPVLKTLHLLADRVLASVPNEIGFPYKGYTFHFQHYTPEQFNKLLIDAGFSVAGWFGQHGKESPVESDVVDGRTLIVHADKKLAEVSLPVPTTAEIIHRKHICILGLGPSLESYIDLVKRLGARRVFADEVWAINAVGDCVQCDKIFHMDDVRVQELRSAALPESNIAQMLKWMKTHPGPIITSRLHPDYPGLVEFPLQDVLQTLGYAYFNSTAAYAVAYAIYVGATRISFFGCDFTYPNSHQAEKGRGCVEFWLGQATARGIQLAISEKSTLMDTMEGPANTRLYGYDTVDVAISDAGAVTFTERDAVATAAEIEARYDHSVHPNKLVKEAS